MELFHSLSSPTSKAVVSEVARIVTDRIVDIISADVLGKLDKSNKNPQSPESKNPEVSSDKTSKGALNE